MFAKVLPGLREVRNPLVVGWVWLAALWVAFWSHVPDRANATGLVGDVFGLVDWLGKSAVLGAVAFGAYLIGSLVLVDPPPYAPERLELSDAVSRLLPFT